MTGMEARNSAGSGKRVVVQASAVVAVLLLVFLFWRRSQPESLTEGAGRGKIFGENVYWGDFKDPYQLSDPSIKVQSIHGGVPRTLAQADPNHEFYGVNFFSIADGELYYAVQPHIPRPTSAGVVGGGAAAPDRYLGAFLLTANKPSSPETAGQKRGVQKASSFVPKETTFRQVSLQGGTPRDIVALRGESYCLVGSHLFWIQPHPEEVVLVSQGQTLRNRTYWLERTAHSDLMLTSLTDGATRCILSGVSHDTLFHGVEEGVIFSQLSPFPGKPALSYARASDGSVRTLGTLETSLPQSSCREFGGRLYWTVGMPGATAYPTPEVLMSANPDGTDRREVLSGMEGQQLSSLTLCAYQGTLYCALNQLTTDYKSHPKGFLCRLHPEREKPIEILRKLPPGSGGYQFDSGYLYFHWGEPTRSLWAALTDPDAPPKNSSGGYARVPLDH